MQKDYKPLELKGHMEKGVWIAIVAIALVVLGGAFYYYNNNGGTYNLAYNIPSAQSDNINNTTTNVDNLPATSAKTFTVEITSSGFSPNPVEINGGDTIVFLNKDSSDHWVASAIHPTHTSYPESGGCIGRKFDSCRRLAAGENFTFTFNQVGSWNYHDHLNPSLTGTVVVK